MTGHTNDIQVVTAAGSDTGWAIACCVCGWAGDHQNWGTEPGTMTRDGAARAARRQADGHVKAKAVVNAAPAEHVATLVAHSPGRVVSMTCNCGVSVVGDVMPFAGVTRLMLEHLNGGERVTRSIPDPPGGVAPWAY